MNAALLVSFVCDYISYSRARYTKLLGKPGVRPVARRVHFSDFRDLLIGESGIGVGTTLLGGSNIHPSFFHHVVNVISLCPGLEVRRVYARGIVTSDVHDNHAIGNRAVVENITEDVSTHSDSRERGVKDSVIVPARSLPLPAFIRAALVGVGPKVLLGGKPVSPAVIADIAVVLAFDVTLRRIVLSNFLCLATAAAPAVSRLDSIGDSIYAIIAHVDNLLHRFRPIPRLLTTVRGYLLTNTNYTPKLNRCIA